jgi:hypothetical protein
MRAFGCVVFERLTGQRFRTIKVARTDASAAPPAMIVVQHWDEELKCFVPTKWDGAHQRHTDSKTIAKPLVLTTTVHGNRL